MTINIDKMRALLEAKQAELRESLANLTEVYERRDHHPVPIGQHFVVAPGPHAPLARFEQTVALFGQDGVFRWRELRHQHAVQYVAPARLAVLGKISVARDVVGGFEARDVRTGEHGVDLLFGPDVEPALFALAVGIEA